MEIPETKRFIPKGFELGTTFTWRNRSIVVLTDHLLIKSKSAVFYSFPANLDTKSQFPKLVKLVQLCGFKNRCEGRSTK